MARDVPVGNGSLLVTFDADYRLRDLYFPYVGQENHTAGHPCRFGFFGDRLSEQISLSTATSAAQEVDEPNPCASETDAATSDRGR